VDADPGAETLNVRAPGVAPRTQHGSILGTPGYMAPEQARGEIARLDARTDVFALGAVLGFLLDVPQEAKRAGVPRTLRAVVNKAMSHDPRDRYATAGDVAAEVDRFLEGRPVEAHPESLATRAARFLWRHRIAVVLLLAYALVRALVLISRRS
jgi:serine/threonine-protein kinase